MKTFKTSREIPATPEQVFAAFDSDRLARWWGPAGFTNTISLCEFKTGGRWELIMHGPDGKNYPNVFEFLEVTAPKKVVMKHDQEPKFVLTIELAPSGKGTLLNWTQTLENSEIAEKIAHIVEPANEQNLDKLTSEVIGYLRS